MKEGGGGTKINDALGGFKMFPPPLSLGMNACFFTGFRGPDRIVCPRTSAGMRGGPFELLLTAMAQVLLFLKDCCTVAKQG